MLSGIFQGAGSNARDGQVRDKRQLGRDLKGVWDKLIPSLRGGAQEFGIDNDALHDILSRLSDQLGTDPDYETAAKMAESAIVDHYRKTKAATAAKLKGAGVGDGFLGGSEQSTDLDLGRATAAARQNIMNPLAIDQRKVQRLGQQAQVQGQVRDTNLAAMNPLMSLYGAIQNQADVPVAASPFSQAVGYATSFAGMGGFGGGGASAPAGGGAGGGQPLYASPNLGGIDVPYRVRG